MAANSAACGILSRKEPKKIEARFPPSSTMEFRYWLLTTERNKEIWLPDCNGVNFTAERAMNVDMDRF